MSLKPTWNNMTPLKHYLDEIQRDKEKILSQLKVWVNINSGSENLGGLAKMLQVVHKDFSILGGKAEFIDLPPRKSVDAHGNLIEKPSAQALRIKKHNNSRYNVLLGGHIDTVYSVKSKFQKVEKISPEKWRGPGITDMKGGIIVMLKALEVLEKSSLAGQIGWEVLINPDEEIGSPGSEHLFKEAAQRHDMGLIFEPSFSDGSLVSARKGTLNYAVVAYGKSAHAGRDFYEGRNAIVGLAKWIISAERMNDKNRGITVNVGQVEGGNALNIVPDLAICRLNLRMDTPQDFDDVKAQIHQLNSSNDEIRFVLHPLSERGPKPFLEKEQKLFGELKQTAQEIGISLQWRPSGGVCDGNILAAEGLPTIDTLGVIGGNIHTDEEYVLTNSLVERAGLTAAFLLKLAGAHHG